MFRSMQFCGGAERLKWAPSGKQARRPSAPHVLLTLGTCTMWKKKEDRTEGGRRRKKKTKNVERTSEHLFFDFFAKKRLNVDKNFFFFDMQNQRCDSLLMTWFLLYKAVRWRRRMLLATTSHWILSLILCHRVTSRRRLASVQHKRRLLFAVTPICFWKQIVEVLFETWSGRPLTTTKHKLSVFRMTACTVPASKQPLPRFASP